MKETNVDVLAPHVQAMEASWDSLCPDMREQIFALLSLLDLGGAAPVSREFSAAYKARLSAAHPAAVEAGVSAFGEAFLRKLTTQIVGPCSGAYLMYSKGADVNWSMSYDATEASSDSWARLLHTWGGFPWPPLYDYCGRPSRDYHVFSEITPECPSFSIRCVKQRGALRVTVICDSAHCREAAGAVAAVCDYLEPELEWSVPRRYGKPLKAALVFQFTHHKGAAVAGYLRQAELNGIAAALLPLSELVDIKRVSWSLPHRAEQPGVAAPSLWQLQAICQE
jgi:hypothetical protein